MSEYWSYRSWQDAVSKRLLETYCITIADAGFDAEYLISHWRSGQEPSDFVEWLGRKYDLVSKRDAWLEPT